MDNNKKNLIFIIIILIAVLTVVSYILFSKSNISGVSVEVDPLMTTFAGKPAGNESGNVWEILKQKGLQGEHFTLNIHGKKSDFNKQDCTVAPDPITGSYSNNIFVPSYSSQSTASNQIVMSSGNAKGKWASTNQTYGVRDACTAAFDGDAAELVIPANEKGYYVVARVLGKPTDNPQLQLDGSLVWVQDELGNDLLVLGLVTDGGFQTPSTTLTRAKGKVSAVDITGLFEWNGSVCYFDPTNYCYDDAQQFTCTNTSMCCQDSDANGVYESCTSPVVVDGLETCSTGYNLTTLACQDYTNEWVFNIGDFVGYMWDTYTDGNFKLANIRLYPVR